MKRKADDPRNQLYLEMIRVIRDKKPKYFIAENVRGILSLDKGKVIEQIVSDFNELNYTVKYSLLNCADYGVPQKRMRVIILGVRKDIPNDLIFPPLPTHTEIPNMYLAPWVTVGEALAHYPDPDLDHNVPNHAYSNFKLKFNGHLGHRIIDPNQPSPTITGRGDEKGGVVVLHHPNNTRRMTVRETAAVQSFPDDFIFIGTKTSAYRQIANAVPPKLGYILGCMLLKV